MRRSALDAGRLGRHKHIVHGLMEIDVSKPRSIISDIFKRTGEKISFTAFIIYCLGKAIEKHPHLHAYLNWRHQLIIFRDIQIVAMIECLIQNHKIPIPHLFKNVNHRGPLDLTREIRQVQTSPETQRQYRSIALLYHLPGPLRRLLSKAALKVPQWFRKYASPVMVTSIGMFGEGAGWGIPKSSFTLTATVGGIAKKPWVVDDRIAIRDIMHLTISVNHDIVDGAPAARFVADLQAMLQSGMGLSLTHDQSAMAGDTNENSSRKLRSMSD